MARLCSLQISIATWGVLGARKVGPKEPKSGGEQGSVLAQFAGKAEEPP